MLILETIVERENCVIFNVTICYHLINSFNPSKQQKEVSDPNKPFEDKYITQDADTQMTIHVLIQYSFFSWKATDYSLLRVP